MYFADTPDVAISVALASGSGNGSDTRGRRSGFFLGEKEARILRRRRLVEVLRRRGSVSTLLESVVSIFDKVASSVVCYELEKVARRWQLQCISARCRLLTLPLGPVTRLYKPFWIETIGVDVSGIGVDVSGIRLRMKTG